jgi:hypothetical protein
LNNIKFEIKDYMNWKLFKSGMKFWRNLEIFFLRIL